MQLDPSEEAVDRAREPGTNELDRRQVSCLDFQPRECTDMPQTRYAPYRYAPQHITVRGLAVRVIAVRGTDSRPGKTTLPGTSLGHALYTSSVIHNR